MNLENFYEMIEKICPTYHYESESEEFPRQVYTEYAMSYEYASNNTYERKISVNLEHYTKEEFDKTERILELVMMLNKNITFNKEINFDEKSKIITNSYDIDITEDVSEEDMQKELSVLLSKRENKNA